MGTSSRTDDEPGLREYIGVLRRRRFALIMPVLLIVCLATALSFFQSPVYLSGAKVLLQTRTSESLFDPNTGQRADPVRAMQTEIQILESEPIRAEVRKELGPTGGISAVSLGQTDLIAIQATSGAPARAAQIANAYTKAYISFRQKQAVDDVLAAAQQIQSKIGDIQKQIDSLSDQVSAAAPAQQSSVREGLALQRDALVAQQNLFKQKLDQLQVDAALKSGGAQLVSEATVPTSPISPKPIRSAVIAFGFGLVVGVGLAFLVDYLDDSVKTKDDVVRIVPDVPVVGLIPAVIGWKDTDAPQVVSIDDPRSAAAEAYRSVRTSVQFLGLERPIQSLQVTSPNAREGKTTTLVNLGVALARAGQRVVLLCCDLRRPRVHEFFGLENTVGFTSVLLGKVPLSAAIQPVPSQPRLSLLASGPLPPNPSELLSSKRTADVLASLQAQADLVLVDSPPILPVTDALILSGQVDATLLVCVAGATTRKDASRAVELLQQVNAPLVGTVLNGVTADSGYGYDGGYYYRYEQESPNGSPAENGRASKEPLKRR